MLKFVVEESSSGSRIDKFLQTVCPDFSRTDLQKLLLAKKVLFQGKELQKNFRVETGMEIEVLALPEKENAGIPLIDPNRILARSLIHALDPAKLKSLD